jgi:peptide-methionine (S)-S-oxide reductase
MQKLILAALVATSLTPALAIAKTETAIVAGGCFWCVESDFDKVKGVISTTSGYAGGTMKNPTYQNHEGNQEAVKVEFDPDVISYDKLIAGFLRTIDVTDDGGQFCDRGSSYFSGIWPMDDAQKAAAEKAVKDAEASLGKKIVTPIKPFTTFADAEDYHQNYHTGENRVLTRFGWVKQSYAYEQYREGCGRDEQVKSVWGKAAFTNPSAE